MMKKNIAVETVGARGSLTCAASSFGGADPYPEGQKACFCDSAMT